MRKLWEKFLEDFFCFFFKEAKKEVEATVEEEIPYASEVKTTERELQKQDIIAWIKASEKYGTRKKVFSNTIISEKLKKELEEKGYKVKTSTGLSGDSQVIVER